MDDWRPTATIETLRLRAQLLARVRDFFARRQVLEVETPMLSAAGATDPNLHSYRVAPPHGRGAAEVRYLHTSPEFPMKRLLAADSGPIYQICKAFRAGERGRRHNPEFTLLEWYRPGWDYHALMDEVHQLVATALEGFRRLAAPERLTYREAFRRHAGVDLHTTDAAALARVADTRGLRIQGLAPDDADGWRDLLLTHLVEPSLGQDRPTFLYDYPASAAALARLRLDEPPVAERFELYLDGIELANGFQELTDPAEQHARFERDRVTRRAQGLPDVPLDERLIGALAHGLPACSGVALGFDRLVMLAAGASAIDDVLAFPYERA